MKIRILAVVAALLAAGSVQALPTVSIIWKQTGTDTINANSVAVGQLVNANIVITADVAGAPNVIGVFVSVDFNNTKLDITCGAGAGPRRRSCQLPTGGLASMPLAVPMAAAGSAEAVGATPMLGARVNRDQETRI